MPISSISQEGSKRQSEGGLRLDAAASNTCHVAFPKALGGLIRAEAGARNLSVTAFVQLAMQAVLQDARLLDRIDDDASYLGTAKQADRNQLRGADGMTQNQRAILYIAATHAGADGRCRLGPKGFAALTAMTQAAAHWVMHRLADADLMTLHQDWRNGPILWVELTEDGWAASRRLTGVDQTGGVA